MTEAEVLQRIMQFIVTNGNNEITANVLRPILVDMLSQPNDKIGELEDLSTTDKSSIVAAINELVQSDSAGFEIHTGSDDPNVLPPSDYSIGDWYIRSGQFLYQYNGTDWILLADTFTGDGNSVVLDDGTSLPIEYFNSLQEWEPEEIVEDRGLNDVFRIFEGSIYRLGDVTFPYDTGTDFTDDDWDLVLESGSGKLDAGGYEGTAEDLKNDIDNFKNRFEIESFVYDGSTNTFTLTYEQSKVIGVEIGQGNYSDQIPSGLVDEVTIDSNLLYNGNTIFIKYLR